MGLQRVLHSLGEDAGVLYDLTIHVGEVAGEIVGTAKLIETVRGRLRGGEGAEEKRRAKIYFANGDEREFILGDVSN